MISACSEFSRSTGGSGSNMEGGRRLGAARVNAALVPVSDD